MNSPTPSYHGYRFPRDIIAHAVWLYFRFSLSFRDVEDLRAQRSITVTYETIRQWCHTFGRAYARRLRQRRGQQGDTWHLDELFVAINGRRHYLWRAWMRTAMSSTSWCSRAAVRFFRQLLKKQGRLPRRLITDRLRSYPAAHRSVMPSVAHCIDQYANNRVEVSHQPTRQRGRQMRRFKSPVHLQRFAAIHGAVQNLFRVSRHLLRAVHQRLLRSRAFAEWETVTCASAPTRNVTHALRIGAGRSIVTKPRIAGSHSPQRAISFQDTSYEYLTVWSVAIVRHRCSVAHPLVIGPPDAAGRAVVIIGFADRGSPDLAASVPALGRPPEISLGT